MSYTNLTYDDRLNNALLKSVWLQRDFADFVAFNSVKFTTQYVADFQAAYQTALGTPSDEHLTDLGTYKTAVVQQKMEAARGLYQRKIKYFVETAFADRVGVRGSFGYESYPKARASVADMIAFLTTLEVRCEQEEATLRAVGIADTFLTDIATAKNELAAAYTEQKTHFGAQKEMTQARKTAFERIDAFVKEVCRVGKIIYEGVNAAKYSDYLVYKTRTNSETVTKIVPAHTELAVLETEAQENTHVQVENIGEATLTVYVNDAPATGAVGYTLTVGAATILSTNTLSVGGYGMLLAQNAQATAGKLRVKLMEVAEEDG